MSVNFAFCNDCDLLTWESYKEVHQILDSLNLPAGDSFWLFDPSGSDMGLFTHDLKHLGPRHSELLGEIESGRMDVIHSAGSYGKAFNRGFRPERNLVEGALEYLSKHARVPKIWSNHGDIHNTQNIGGRFPQPHHRGDLKGSQEYMLDLLLEYGVEYFWLDRLLVRDPSTPYRILAKERCRSGQEIKTFSRLLGLETGTPNGQNLGFQLSRTNLDSLLKIQQSAVLYQHFGAHHGMDGRAFPAPKGKCFGPETIAGLEELAELKGSGKLNVVRLENLLKAEEQKSIATESQRIGEIAVLAEKGKDDDFYYRQYHVRSVQYFEKRIARLGLSGGTALDAGCGVGQWSFALTNFFDVVHGIDFNPIASTITSRMTELLRQDSPTFVNGSIESLPYKNDSFDTIVCYGVIFCTDTEKSLKEFFRVLKPGGTAYVCLNGDGWYEQLVEERFRQRPLQENVVHALPLWNSLYFRAGGKRTFDLAMTDPDIQRIAYSENYCSDAPRNLLTVFAKKYLSEEFRMIVDNYGQEVGHLVGLFLCRYLQILKDPELDRTVRLRIALDRFVLRGRYLNKKFESFFGPQIGHYFRMVQRLIWSAGKFAFEFARKTNRSIVTQLQFLRSTQCSTTDGMLVGPPLEIGRSNSSNNVPISVDHLVFRDVSRAGRVYLPHEFEKMARDIGFTDFEWGTDAQLVKNSSEISVEPIYDQTYRNKIAVWECIIRKPRHS